MAFTPHPPPFLNEPHILVDGTIYVNMQALSQRMGAMRYAVLPLPHPIPPHAYSTG